jgi:c-di-GMP-binding flagellar brake protein YcgR
MSAQPLQLNIGDTIQLQLAGDMTETRHLVRVIGYQPGVSLLVSTPRVNASALLAREGNPLTVRLLAQNTVYGFESKLLKVCTAPFAYWHVAYPKEFASAVVRKAQRASTKVIASVDNANQPGEAKEPYSVVISDLSVAGASLLAPEPFGKEGDSVMIRCKVTVGGIEKYLSLAAVIRSIKRREEASAESARYRHGIEFQMLDPNDQLVLHGYVYEQIAMGKAV